MRDVFAGEKRDVAVGAVGVLLYGENGAVSKKFS